MTIRTSVAAFASGAIVSILSGRFTGGVAAAYAFVALWVWRIVTKVSTETLANQRWLIMSLTACVHGLLFVAIVAIIRSAFPQLEKTRFRIWIFFVGILLYGLLLSFAFPADVP